MHVAGASHVFLKRMMRRAFTLIELLTVIAVIAILVALLVPAVQMTRATARRALCSNNKKQVALGVLNHVSAHNRLPSLIDRRFQPPPDLRGLRSSVSWRFTIAPFLELNAIHDALQHPSAWKVSFDSERTKVPSMPMAAPVFRCPSDPEPYFFDRGLIVSPDEGRVLFDALQPADCAAPFQITNFPLQRGIGMMSQHAGAWFGTRFYYGDPFDVNYDFRLNASHDARYRAAKLQRITDGLSQTVLVAEKAGGTHVRNRDRNGEELFQRPISSAWTFTTGGFAIDWRTPSINRNNQIGVFSFHNGAHVAMCDGAVRFLPEDITATVLGALLIRNDGLVTTNPF